MTLKLKNNTQVLGTGTTFLQAKEGYLSYESPPGAYRARNVTNFFPTIRSTQETTKKIPTNELHMRTNFQRFLNETPRSSFKKLITSMPLLLRGLRTMSLTTSVPDGHKPQECERTKLRKPQPIPYIPEKDKVQEEVARLRNLQIKTLLEKDTTLNFLVWHENGT
jgi:hypothetical protein